jgi:hypothetical protein
MLNDERVLPAGGMSISALPALLPVDLPQELVLICDSNVSTRIRQCLCGRERVLLCSKRF